MRENKVVKALKEPKKIIQYLDYRGVFNFLSDKVYLKLMYKLNNFLKITINQP